MGPHFSLKGFAFRLGVGVVGPGALLGQALWDLEALEALIARVQVSWS